MSKRILILSDINSAHTQKWCEGLAQKGVNVGVFSLTFPTNRWYETFENIKVFCPIRFEEKIFHASSLNKLKYLKAIPALKKVIREFNPEIVHAHYATSYGLLGALSGFQPFLISAWGSDLMEFPGKSRINSRLIKYILNKAEIVFSTSETLAAVARKFTAKRIEIISFGINIKKFIPMEVENIFEKNCFVIGTIKSLEKIYGIDILIKAFAQLNLKYPSGNLRLLIVGSGSREAEYKSLVDELNIRDKTFFAGRIPHNDLARYYNMLDVFVNVSHNESFGVSVLEASACEKPVVLTSVGGLVEVGEDYVTGIFVPDSDVTAVANALEKLLLDSELRKRLGTNGRRKVEQEYDFEKCLEKQLEFYKEIV